MASSLPIAFPLSPRIQMMKAIGAKLRPEPVREPLPPPKRYEAPLGLRPASVANWPQVNRAGAILRHHSKDESSGRSAVSRPRGSVSRGAVRGSR
jgi:hypothetical protein